MFQQFIYIFSIFVEIWFLTSGILCSLISFIHAQDPEKTAKVNSNGCIIFFPNMYRYIIYIYVYIHLRKEKHEICIQIKYATSKTNQQLSINLKEINMQREHNSTPIARSLRVEDTNLENDLTGDRNVLLLYSFTSGGT